MKIIHRHPEKVNKPSNPIKKKTRLDKVKIIDSKIFFQTSSCKRK